MFAGADQGLDERGEWNCSGWSSSCARIHVVLSRSPRAFSTEAVRSEEGVASSQTIGELPSGVWEHCFVNATISSFFRKTVVVFFLSILSSVTQVESISRERGVSSSRSGG